MFLEQSPKCHETLSEAQNALEQISAQIEHSVANLSADMDMTNLSHPAKDANNQSVMYTGVDLPYQTEYAPNPSARFSTPFPNEQEHLMSMSKSLSYIAHNKGETRVPQAPYPSDRMDRDTLLFKGCAVGSEPSVQCQAPPPFGTIVSEQTQGKVVLEAQTANRDEVFMRVLHETQTNSQRMMLQLVEQQADRDRQYREQQALNTERQAATDRQNQEFHQRLLSELMTKQTDAIERQNDLQESQARKKLIDTGGVRNDQIPTFDGTNKFGVAKFFKDFEFCARQGNWNNVTTMLKLSLAMSGTAQLEFDRLGPFDSLQSAKEALFSVYLKQIDRSNYSQKKCMQKHGESTEQYYARFVEWGEISYGHQPEVMKQCSLCVDFARGFNNQNLGKQVTRSEPSTIEQALLAAQKEEVVANIFEGVLPSNTNEKTCHDCQGKGHIARDCANRRNTHKGTIDTDTTHSRYIAKRGRDPCIHCGKNGHAAGDCFTLTRNRQFSDVSTSVIQSQPTNNSFVPKQPRNPGGGSNSGNWRDKSNSDPGEKCVKCGRSDHKTFQCKEPQCSICKLFNHVAMYCPKRGQTEVKCLETPPGNSFMNDPAWLHMSNEQREIFLKANSQSHSGNLNAPLRK